MNLKHLVDAYLRNNKYDWILSECRPGKRPAKEVIEYAVTTKTPKLEVCHRNYSDKNTVRKNMIKRLQRSFGTLGTPTTFEEIMEWVYSEKVDGFGPVGVFDTSLRMGVYLGIYPNMVYIHAGSEAGTKALLGDRYKLKAAYFFMNDPEYPVLAPAAYPQEINKLEPYHIENFLCQRIDKLKKLSLPLNSSFQ